MPPKRKQTDVESEPAATASSRSTRSSGRLSGGASSTASAKPAASTSKTMAKTKAKTSSKETTEKRTAIGRGSKIKPKANELAQTTTESEENLEPPLKKGKRAAASNGKAKPESFIERKSSKVSKASLKSFISAVKHSPYAKARMEKLFAAYADVEDPSILGGEGLEKLCTDANIPMEGAQLLILAWLLEASELGRLTKEEWLKGMDALQIDTLEKLNIALTEMELLLISNAPVPKPPATNKKPVMEPYDRNAKYWQYTADVSSAFLKFYTFVFSLAKAPQERNIDMEMAKVFWSTLLAQKYPLVNDLIEFINNKASVKGVNKDLWAMTLDFFRSVSPSLEDYEDEGAWPTLLDEFVAWKRAGHSSTITAAAYAE